MAGTGFFHHVGTFLLFVATILLIVTCISAPVVHNLSLLKVELGDSSARDQSTVTFGSFGYCQSNNGGVVCSQPHIGYSPAAVMASIDGTTFSGYAEETSTGLTRAMILHPVACVINFVAFLLALGAGFIGSFLASVVAALTFLVTVIVCIIDFALFGIVKSDVNSHGAQSGASAQFGAAAWTTLISALCSLLGAVVVFFTCCSARLHRRRQAASAKGEFGGVPAKKSRFRFW